MKTPFISIEKITLLLAFLVVLIIWSTTPLAIQWSSVDSPLTSALLRMLIGALFCAMTLILLQRGLPFDRAAKKIYLLSGLSIFVCMTLFYSASQLIPSGWVAVLFGLSPLSTGLFSAIVEPETKLTPSRIIGLLLGLSGLYLVFSAGLNFEDASLLGVTLVLSATLISSATSVISRQLMKDQSLSGMQITTGSLVVAIPCFALAVLVFEPGLNLSFSTQAMSAIVYLGFIGTGVGFTLYYYLLKRVSANRLSLVTLITPITALSVGSLLNNEPLVPEVWMGASLVSIGLLLYEFKPKLGLRKL